MAPRVVARVQTTFGVDTPLVSIIRRPTIAEQADEIQDLVLQRIEGLSDEEAARLLESMGQSSS